VVAKIQGLLVRILTSSPAAAVAQAARHAGAVTQ
jgi:hypothetical protein